MLLKDVLEKKSKDVHTISSNASADDVVTELVRFNIGSLLVRDSPERTDSGHHYRTRHSARLGGAPGAARAVTGRRVHDP